MENVCYRVLIMTHLETEDGLVSIATGRGSRIGFGEDTSADWCGTELYSDEYGEWRTVPGFPVDRIIVSSMGWVRNNPEGSPRPPFKPTQTSKGYRVVGFDHHLYQVHALVCRAWHGPCPIGCTSVDHIAKYDGDRSRERSDNRAENVRWATAADQANNRTVSKRHRTSEGVFLRHRDWPDERSSLFFSSISDAAGALGLRKATVSEAAHGKRTDASGYLVELQGPLEPQHDLPAEGNQPLEEWIAVNDRLWVSNRGRAQILKAVGGTWRPRFTPAPCESNGYAMIGRSYFHRLVFSAFGGILVDGETVDHIDRNRSNNVLTNLRAASAQLQAFNQNRKPRSTTHMARKNPVVAIPPTQSEYTTMQFYSQQSAARELRRITQLPFSAGHINNVIHGKRAHHQGWRFRHV